MPEDNQPGLLARFIIDPIKNAQESDNQKNLMKTIKMALRTDDASVNWNKVVEQGEISESTKKRIQELATRYSPEATQKAVDDIVKVVVVKPGEHPTPLLSSEGSALINITPEALDKVHGIINDLKNAGNAGKDTTLQAAKPSKNASSGRGS